MELRQYFLLFRRWAWLIILGGAIGGTGAFVWSQFQTPVYQATSKVMVSPPGWEQLSEFGYMSGQQLIQTYAQLIVTDPVLEAVSERVNYAISSGMITVKQISDTQILEVRVQDSDPIRAAVVATLLIDALIANNDAFQSNRFDISEESLLSQIEVVDAQIANLQIELSTSSQQYKETKTIEFEIKISELQLEILDIEFEIARLFPENESELLPTATLDSESLADLQQMEFQLSQRQSMLNLYEQLYFDLISPNASNGAGIANGEENQSQTTLSLYQEIYSNLLSDLAEVRLSKLENTPTVVQVEPATPPKVPIRPRPTTNTMLGITVGIMIAIAIAFIIEYMDDRINSPEDIRSIIDAPLLGYISEIDNSNLDSDNIIYVGNDPQSRVDEEFRSLRTNIEFINADAPIRTILVTSPGANEGKSTIASNLALALIENNKRVVLIDADLRRPTLHKIFKLGNRVGLSEYLRGRVEHKNIGTITHKSKRLLVIPSGKLPINPAELLNSNKLKELFIKLEKVSDYVIIDSPPLVVTDPVILSAVVDGVLIVTHTGRTRKNTLKGALEHLVHSKSRILGVIFNRISAQTAYYYQYHFANYYSSYDYISKDENEGGILNNLSRIFKTIRNRSN